MTVTPFNGPVVAYIKALNKDIGRYGTLYTFVNTGYNYLYLWWFIVGYLIIYFLLVFFLNGKLLNAER